MAVACLRLGTFAGESSPGRLLSTAHPACYETPSGISYSLRQKIESPQSPPGATIRHFLFSVNQRELNGHYDVDC